MYGYDMYKIAPHGMILSTVYLFGDLPLFLSSCSEILTVHFIHCKDST